jgi:GT2 family glycosyltransferase
MIAVIVINYKNEDKTISFVRDELSKIKADHEIVIVNNGADNASSSKLKDALPDSHIIDSEENLGFAKGNNLGAEYARDHFFGGEPGENDFLLFSNNDIHFIDSDVADSMAAKLSQLPDAAAIGPKVVGLDGRLQSPEPFQPFLDRHFLIYWSNLFMSKAKRIRRFRLDYAEKAKEGYHYRLMGSIFMVKAKEYFECGEMDPATFLFCEEPILSERLKKIRKKVYYFPRVAVLHEHGTTTKKYFERKELRQMGFKSECYYYRTYIGTPEWQIMLAKITYWIKGLFGRF